MAAVNTISIAEVTPVCATQDNHTILSEVYHDLRTQINLGRDRPSVAFHSAAVLGVEGLDTVRGQLEAAFGCEMIIDINAIANTITVLPTVPDIDVSPIDACDDVEGKGKVTARKIKVARPPNAFILYRKQWHPYMVAKNPLLGNNDISKIIGQQWRNEPKNVKEEFQRKAEIAKREHAVLHPTYTYQPRRPHERKKRMTKKKLLRLAANAKLPTEVAESIAFHNGPMGMTASFTAIEDPEECLKAIFNNLPAPSQTQGRRAAYAIGAEFATMDDDLAGHVLSFPGEVQTYSDVGLEQCMLDAVGPEGEGQLADALAFDPSAQKPVETIEPDYYEAEADRQVGLMREMAAFFDFEGAADGTSKE